MTTWENLTEIEQLQSTYSDTYKEAHGSRPRHDTSGWSVADFEQVLRQLYRIIEQNAVAEQAAQKRAADAVEATIAGLIRRGAADRAAAIRWLHQAEETNGDNEYLAYRLGVEYGYFR